MLLGLLLSGTAARALTLDASVAESRSKREDPLGNRRVLPGADKPRLPVFGEADEMDGRSERDVTLRGDAVLRREGSVIRGDRITYYEAEDEVFVFGNARVVRDGNVFVGRELRLKLDSNEGVFTEPHYRLPAYRGQGAAERIEFLGKNRVRFINGYYTTCQGESPSWCLRAESITLDEEQGEGRARSASLYFGNTKVLGLPVFYFPLGEGRKTGFLPPTFSVTTSNGFEMAMPFYWNMAPNYDLTLTPRVMSKRGILLGSQFRYITDRQYGELRYDHNPHDREYGDKRYTWNWQHVIPDFNKWRVGVNYQGVSDDTYFIDYSRSVQSSATRLLPREITASRRFDDWTVIARYSRWQPLLEQKTSAPYESVPQFSLLRDSRDVNGLDLNVLADLSQFRRAYLPGTSPRGWRAVLYPQISYPIQKAGWFVIPKLGLHASAYRLDDNAGNPTSLNRSVPIFSLDAGMVFEREASFFGTRLNQTLEPRLFYVRSPYRDQGAFPVFDTTVSDFNFAQLFSTNTFVGQDRIADQNQLTAVLISRLIDPDNGAERFRFAVGERLYFTPQQVQIPGVAANTDTRSDLLFAMTAQIGRFWALDTGLQYSVRDGRIPRFSVSSRYTPASGNIFNAAIRYQRDTLGQVDTSWRWPIAPQWMTLGRLNYSFLDTGLDPLTGAVTALKRGLVESVAGVEYTADCWVFRAVLQRYATSATDSRTTLFFQVELSGLGRIGNDPFDILRRNIPGYRVPNDRVETPSRFFGYE